MSAKNEVLVARGEREIVVSRIVNAPRELVWEAMTDPAQVVKWWGPRAFRTTIEMIDVRPGGAWNHVMHGPDGTDYPNRSVFSEVVRPERIVFSHGGGKKGGPDVQFVATWTFDALGAAVTRVTVRMVFSTAAERDRVDKEFGAVEGARQTLERMAEHLLDRGAEPGAFVIERVVDAPRDIVFRAWTEAERLARWFGPKGCTIRKAKIELRPGGACHYCMRMPGGPEIWGKWVFREIVAPARIVFVHSFSDEKGGLARHPMIANWPLEILATTTFEEQGHKTRVTVTWVPHKPTAAEREAFESGRDLMKMGWTGTFEQLEAYLALPNGGVP